VVRWDRDRDDTAASGVRCPGLRAVTGTAAG
jgi:hypothetical protein